MRDLHGDFSVCMHCTSDLQMHGRAFLGFVVVPVWAVAVSLTWLQDFQQSQKTVETC